jgi:hypothetical protein
MSARTVAAVILTCAALSASPGARAFDVYGFDPFGNVGDFYLFGPDTAQPARTLACWGTLSFGDALARDAKMTVDIERREVRTPDCRKYPHLDRFCSGTLLRIADHRFAFGGVESWENTKLWADLYRPSNILTVAENGTDVETMRVMFTGRCTPAAGRYTHARRARDP